MNKTISALNLILFLQFTLLGWRANAQTSPWPEWIFYHWVWEGESTQQSATQIIDDYLQNDIPVGAIIIDSPWETGYNNFEFDTALFQDAQGMVNYFHSKNIRVMLWITSMINIELDSMYNYAKSQNYFMKKNSLDDSTQFDWWKGKGSLLDLFNPAAVSWWKGMMDSALALGIDGWKCDGTDWYANSMPFSPYMNVNMSRNDYSDKYYRLFFDSTRSALGNDRVITARPVDNYGYDIGGLPVSFAPIDINFAGWVGDQDPTFDGLKNGVNNMYYSSQMNYLAFGSDIGGYRDDQTTYPGLGRSKELFIRWAQMGAFSPIMENGGGGEHRPWQFDIETLNIYRKFAKLHHAMVPYFMQAAAAAYQANKSMVYFFNKTDYSYLIGNDLFTAPFLASGININVTFPPGSDNWVYVFDTTKVYAGGSTGINLTIPLDEFPAFIKQGTTLFYDILTAVENEFQVSGFKFQVYPNPSNGKFNVTINSPLTAHRSQIQIYNVLGEKIFQSLVNSHLSLAAPPMTNAPMTIDLSSQPQGIYFVQLKIGDKVYQQKIVK